MPRVTMFSRPSSMRSRTSVTMHAHPTGFVSSSVCQMIPNSASLSSTSPIIVR